MNKVFLIGNLTRDPELTETAGGIKICRFSIAVNRRFKTEGQPDVDFFNCTAWGRTAEVICQYLSKGRQIAIQGRLQTRSYQDRNGNNRTSTDVVAKTISKKKKKSL